MALRGITAIGDRHICPEIVFGRSHEPTRGLLYGCNHALWHHRGLFQTVYKAGMRRYFTRAIAIKI